MPAAAPPPAAQWQQPAPQPAPQPQAWQQTAAAAPQQNWQQPAPQPAPQPQAWQPPAAAAPQQNWQQTAQSPAYQPAPQYQQPAAHQQSAPARAPDGRSVRIEAELGAHSTTNFYKGLSGNDVIDSGGIFIATYNIPSVGQPLSVKVCLPGGYEFEAAAVVRWTRDSPQSGSDSPPGFGAQFTQISPEGRQLVYRYVRNREPLFHDDL